MRRLTIQAAVNTFSGYGNILTEVFSGLEQRGVFCSIRNIEMLEPFGATVPSEIKARFVHCPQPEDWELLIRNPGHKPTPGKRTIAYSMFESTKLAQEWVNLFNKCEHVVVPCQWNERGFKESGVSVPMSVIPLGYSPDIFHYMGPRGEPKFVVGIGGRVSHGPRRKGIRRAIDLFLSAFQNIRDVELHVKVHPDCDLGKPEVNDTRVKIIRDHMGWGKLMHWFSQIDVFMSLATAEGFGLWQLQAMATGRPVIGAPYSGLADFMSKENAYCLPFKEVPNPDYGGGLWAEISDDAVKTALLYAYSHRDETRLKGIAAAETARNFTWGNTVDKLEKLMFELGVWQ